MTDELKIADFRKKLREGDDQKGDLNIEVHRDESAGVVVVNFEQPVGFLALPFQDAANLGLLIFSNSGAKITPTYSDEALGAFVDAVFHVINGEYQTDFVDRDAAIEALRGMLNVE